MDLKLKPFVVDRRAQPRAERREPATPTWVRDVGLDARYGVTAGPQPRRHLNTDFAQVEVDEQQVNLTRFGLFFPEKRDFFLENSNAVRRWAPARRSRSTPVQTDLFFSRRIGLSDTGQPVPIIGGARLAGKVGQEQHRACWTSRPTARSAGRATTSSSSRYSRDVLQRSRVGAIFINKESVDGSDHYNRTMGVDAQLQRSAATSR